MTTTHSRRAAVDWLFRNRKTGRITVMQRPNLPLILFIACRLVEWLLSGSPADVLRWVGSAALLLWALDEIARGVNPFRRALGALVLGGMIVSVVLALT